jgi:hypothetical protein
MIKVKYKGKIWKVLVPSDLTFPPGVIRNLLIERGTKRVITNMNQVSIVDVLFEMERWI